MELNPIIIVLGIITLGTCFFNDDDVYQQSGTISDDWQSYIGVEGMGRGYQSLFRNRHFDTPEDESLARLNTSLFDELQQVSIKARLIGRNRVYILPIAGRLQDRWLERRRMPQPVCRASVRVKDMVFDLDDVLSKNVPENQTLDAWLIHDRKRNNRTVAYFVCDGACCDVDCCKFVWWAIPLQFCRLLWLLALAFYFVYYTTAGIYVMAVCIGNTYKKAVHNNYDSEEDLSDVFEMPETRHGTTSGLSTTINNNDSTERMVVHTIADRRMSSTAQLGSVTGSHSHVSGNALNGHHTRHQRHKSSNSLDLTDELLKRRDQLLGKPIERSNMVKALMEPS